MFARYLSSTPGWNETLMWKGSRLNCSSDCTRRLYSGVFCIHTLMILFCCNSKNHSCTRWKKEKLAWHSDASLYPQTISLFFFIILCFCFNSYLSTGGKIYKMHTYKSDHERDFSLSASTCDQKLVSNNGKPKHNILIFMAYHKKLGKAQ